MRSVLRNYMGMIAIAIVAMLVVGALAVRIDRSQTPDAVQGIAATPAMSGNAPGMLVDARWLLQYGSQVDYIYDLGDIRQYNQGHIPGAHHIYWQDAMRLHTANYGEADQISAETAPGDVFGNLHLNIPQNARVVLYDSNNSERAAWLLWVMITNGYTDVHVLDGGLRAWVGAGGELQTEAVPAPANELVATPAWNEAVVIRRESVLERLDDPSLHLVDTRTAKQQQDTVNGTIREGHIPDSVNITNTDVQRADGTFKTPQELRELFASYGIDLNDDVVVYSLFSSDSGPVWLAFELAGYENVRIYQEGYVAWGFNTDLPISTGPYSTPAAATPMASPVASPVASPLASPELATPVGSPVATPEDGPTDLTGN